MGPTGLTLARSLARRGVRVIGVHPNPNEPCLSTRAATIHVLPSIDDESAWLEYLLEQGRAAAPERPVILPAGDAYWMLLARHREELAPYFRFAMPDGSPEELAQWPSKPFQYALAARAGVMTPTTLHPRTMAQVREWAGRVDYPCLVKPAYTPRWCRSFKGQGKLACVESPEALIAQADAAFAEDVPIMLQACIPGGDEQIYALYAYAGGGGRVLAGSVSRKLRQSPPMFGSGSLSRSVAHPKVARLGAQMLLAMRHHGLASVEFKRDARDDEYKLMEVTLRAPLMLATAVEGGVDLPYVAYQDLIGEPMPEIRPRLGRKVVLLEEDWRAARAYHAAGCLGWCRWALSLLGARELTFAWRDPMPAWRTLGRAVWRARRGTYRRPEPHADALAALQARGWLRPPRGARHLRQTAKAAAEGLLPYALWVKLQAYKRRFHADPPIGYVRLGHLRRTEPVSRDFGFDRGRPIDRWYIERFLAEHSADVRGHVLEIADSAYTWRFGQDRVTRSDILHATAENPRATIVADLTHADHLADNQFDCIIFTQTLQVIYDARAALSTLVRILKPGGVLLLTTSGLGMLSRFDMERWGEYWRFSSMSVQRLLEELVPAEAIQLRTYGNVLAATAFLQGLAAEELTRKELAVPDPQYQLIIAARLVKPIRHPAAGARRLARGSWASPLGPPQRGGHTMPGRIARRDPALPRPCGLGRSPSDVPPTTPGHPPRVRRRSGGSVPGGRG
jgi:predicted ATP-grasp superfamily ATP-dependent carboligase/SAM-dependent methyltransferase